VSGVQYSNSTTSLAYDTSYDSRGNLASITRYTNSAGTALVATTSYSYDTADRLSNITQTNSSGVTLSQSTYTYDNANRLSAKDESGVMTSYSYDAASQLTADGGTAYSYDKAGNRTNSGYETLTGNEVTSDGTYTYSYDAAGNVTQETLGAAGATWKYTYNNANELVGASYSATPTGTVTKMVTYVYDAFGNRIEEEVWNGSTTTVTEYGVDGWGGANSAGSSGSSGAAGASGFNDWVTLNGKGAMQSRQLFGSGSTWVKRQPVSIHPYFLSGALTALRNSSFIFFNSSTNMVSAAGSPPRMTPYLRPNSTSERPGFLASSSRSFACSASCSLMIAISFWYSIRSVRIASTSCLVSGSFTSARKGGITLPSARSIRSFKIL
jgi:YD repeat-containing protein